MSSYSRGRRGDDYKELKNLRVMRIFIAVLYGLQIFLASEPFVEALVNGERVALSPFLATIYMFSAGSFKEFMFFFLMSVLLIFPGVCFFFYCLDKDSNVKSVLSIICCFVTCYLITFEIKLAFSRGALFTLVLSVIIMFFSVVLMLATASYNRELASK